ncbi:hypothetical protein PENTCL1PPCAC_24225, partial [Pristionchus entomophagus]
EEGTQDVMIQNEHQTEMQSHEETAAEASNFAPAESVAQLREIGHPPNIFQLCRPDSFDAISYEKARVEIDFVCSHYEGRPGGLGFVRLPQLLILECEACEKTLPKNQIIPHFLSKGHEKNIHARFSAVSRAAFVYWMDKLQQEPAAQPMQQLEATEAVIEEAAVPDTTVQPLDTGMEPHQIGDSPNIFHLCHPDSWNSIPYEKARERLLSIVREGQPFFPRVNQLFASSPQLRTLAFDCQACEEKFSGSGMLLHFIGMRHRAKVSELGTAVSRAAIEYWVNKLQPESAVQPMLQ